MKFQREITKNKLCKKILDLSKLKSFSNTDKFKRRYFLFSIWHEVLETGFFSVSSEKGLALLGPIDRANPYRQDDEEFFHRLGPTEHVF
jgi:hypothetical protein